MKALTFSRIFRVLAYIGIILFFWLSTSCTKTGLFPDYSKSLRTDTALVTVFQDTVPSFGYWWTCPIHTKHDSVILFHYNTRDTTINDYHIPTVGKVTPIWWYDYDAQVVRYYYNIDSIHYQR